MKKIFLLFLTILTLSFNLGCLTSSKIIHDDIHPYSQVNNDDNPINGNEN